MRSGIVLLKYLVGCALEQGRNNRLHNLCGVRCQTTVNMYQRRPGIRHYTVPSPNARYTFGDRLISRFGPVNWPPRSCDLTPFDYFLWGYVKSLVYADKPQTFDHLEDNILRVIADIRPQMLEIVIENWTSRLDYIRASCGSPMTEIIFKICPTPIIENVDKITEIINVDRHVNNRNIAQELKIDHKTVLSHLRKVGFKKEARCLGATPKNMMDGISICEALAKRNEIDPFLKQIVTEDQKWVTYDNILHEGFLATDHVILNHGQVTWTTPELAPPLLTTTPHQREEVSALDRFNVHRCPTRWVFSGTGLEPVTKQATVRYLYHSATAAVVCLVGLERIHFLGVASVWPNTKFRSLLSTIEPLVASNWSKTAIISNTKGVLHQDNARPLISVVTHQKL
ncbi:uncharacterized protein TNCV_1035141 [Trichonephila clavipes]|nr:uncharacterized protein TNCV_1035141 [Trichonephila clavipes]